MSGLLKTLANAVPPEAFAEFPPIGLALGRERQVGAAGVAMGDFDHSVSPWRAR